MAIKSILAPVTGSPRDKTVLSGAFAAARPFAGHVSALFVRPDPGQTIPFFGEGLSVAMTQEVIDAAREAAEKASAAARDALAAVAQEMPDVSSSFQEAEGGFEACIVHAARLADLVAIGPLQDASHPELTDAFEAVLLETGRPILLTSLPASPDFASHIAIGWNGSMACARAVSAALPYLTRARAVEILIVRRADSPVPGTAELQAYLKLHGIEAAPRTVDAGERAVGDVLLEAAVSGGTNLLVLGGYGHSRLREMFVGGVTRYVIAHAQLPLLLVH